MPLLLNGFQLDLSSPTFVAHVEDVPNPEKMKVLRAEHAENWFLSWRNGKAYGLPIAAEPMTAFGRPTELQCTDNIALGIVAARINSLLPQVFPQYDALYRRPFAFLGRKDELVSATLTQANLQNVNELVRHFSIRPKFELDARLVEVSDGDLRIALIMDVGMRWGIEAPVSELHRAGIDVTGLHVIRRDPTPEQRRLVGRIGDVRNRSICLAESYDGQSAVPCDEVWLEGSTASFYRCLRHLLGHEFGRFDSARFVKESEFLTGPSLDKLLQRMGEVLSAAKSLQVAPSLMCSFGPLIRLANTSDYKSVVHLQNPSYCFDAAKSKRASYAWQGLERYGPYSRDSFPNKSPRILVLCPDKSQGQVEQFVKHFRDGIVSVPSSKFTGLSQVFCLNNPQFVIVPVPLLGTRGGSIGSLYRQAAVDALANSASGYDAALVIIPDQYSATPDRDNPYLHAKAVCLMAGVPVQEARLSTITRSHYELMYVAQNMAIALYAKLGGVPWTVDHDLTVTDEIVIGMGTCELSGSRFDERQRHIGITTVFRGDGNYLLSNLSRECAYAEYPEVLKTSTSDILREIKSRNGWQPGDTVRIVFHAFKPLRNIEVAEIAAECVKELGTDQQFQFAYLTVSHAHPFKLLDTAQGGRSARHGAKKGVYVPDRGVVTQLGRFTRLLSTNGPMLVKRPTSPLPSPLLIHLHPQSTYGALDYLAEQVLKFTSLSWRSTLPCLDPVTIYYSELIAGLLGRLKSVPDWSPAMLNVKLRASRWFL